MRSRVSGATSGRSLITLETVCVDTPAAFATCFIVGRLLTFMVSMNLLSIFRYRYRER